jgi:transposase
VVGIDVSKKKIDVEVLLNGKAKSKVLGNSPGAHQQLIDWLSKFKAPLAEMHVCMEATGVYYEQLAFALHAAGLKVSVVNPACIKGFAQTENLRNKTDAVDAGLIARYCARMTPGLWVPPPLEQRQLRAWSVRLQAMKDMRQQEENRVEAHTISGMDQVAAHVNEHIVWLDTEIAKLEKDIDDHIDRHPGLKKDADLLKSIPGIGTTTVAKVLGQVGNVRRFANAKAFAAYLGVTPRQRNSGSSVRGRTMISRIGHSSMRSALYMPALVAKRYNPVLRGFADRLLATGMAKKAVVGAVMHKLAHLIYGVLTNGKPFDPQYLNKGLAIQDSI